MGLTLKAQAPDPRSFELRIGLLRWNRAEGGDREDAESASNLILEDTIGSRRN